MWTIHSSSCTFHSGVQHAHPSALMNSIQAGSRSLCVAFLLKKNDFLRGVTVTKNNISGHGTTHLFQAFANPLPLGSCCSQPRFYPSFQQQPPAASGGGGACSPGKLDRWLEHNFIFPPMTFLNRVEPKKLSCEAPQFLETAQKWPKGSCFEGFLGILLQKFGWKILTQPPSFRKPLKICMTPEFRHNFPTSIIPILLCSFIWF